MTRYILTTLIVLAVAGAATAQSVIDSWDFNVADGAISTQGSYSDLGGGNITWPDKSVAAISNNVAVFFGQGTNSTDNYFSSAKGLSANANETSGKYQLSVDIVSADFTNTAAKDQKATWGIGLRGSSGDSSTDNFFRLTYDGNLNVTNSTSAGVTNIYADANHFFLSCDAKDTNFGSSANTNFPGSSLSNLNVRQVYDLDAGTYEVYYTLAPATETLLYSGELTDGVKLGELHIASQQFNGGSIWELGDVLAVDNIELTQLVAPTEEDPYTTIEQWDFSGDSLTGLNGNAFPDLDPSVWNDVAGDDALTLSPDANQFRTKNVTITPSGGDMYISWTLNSWDYSDTNTANTAFFGLKGSDTIGIELYSETSNMWASVRAGNTKLVKARIAKGVQTNSSPLQVTARLDYAEEEVQLFISNDGNWQNWTGVEWASSAVIDADYKASFDFSTVLTNGNYTQTRMAVQNFATNEQVTVDQVYIKEAPATNPITVGVIDKAGGTQNNTPGTVNIGTFTAEANDVLVLLASGSNGNHIEADRVAWDSSDGGTTDATTLHKRSAVGIWYATVTASGTFDINYTKTNNYTTVAAYLVRADGGEALSVDIQSVFVAAGGTSAALSYTFDNASDGIIIEALSTGAGGGASADDVMLEYNNSGTMKRGIGSLEFGNETTLNTSWTVVQSGADKNASLAGIAVYKDAYVPVQEDTPSSLYAAWLGSDKSANTNLLEDVDGDGVNNLVAYATGDTLPTQTADSTYLNYVHVQWNASNAAARGLSYEVQANTDLVFEDWATNGVELVGSVDDIPALGYTTVTNRVPVDQDAKFLQLEIIFTP